MIFAKRKSFRSAFIKNNISPPKAEYEIPDRIKKISFAERSEAKESILNAYAPAHK
jgi:hypothetical protein